MKLNPRMIETGFLLALFAILLWMGMGAYYGGKLNQDYPRGFFATDSFYKYNRAVYLDMQSDNKHTPPYLAGGIEGLAQTYPFLSFHDSVLFRYISGLELYNSYYLMKILNIILAGLLSYVILKKYNKKIAILSTGILGFLFIGNFYTPVIFGWGPQIMASALLVFAFWATLNYEIKGFNILLGIFIGAAVLAHPPEAFFAAVIFAVIFIIKFIREKYDLKLLKSLIFPIAIIILVSSYYIPLFLESFLNPSTGSIVSSGGGPPSFPVPFLSTFGLFEWIILFGLIFSFFLLVTKKGKHWQNFTMPFFMLMVTFSVLFISVGHNRFYQNRYFWPVYLSIFFGLGLYTILRYIPMKKPLLIYYSLAIALIAASAVFYYKPISSPGLINNPAMWQGIEWVQNNVPTEDKVLLVYGDSYNQHGILSMFQHVVYYTDWNYIPNNIGYNLSESISKIESGVVTRYYTIRPFIHGQMFVTRESFFNIGQMNAFEALGLNYTKVNGRGRGFEERDICSFDYIVLDKVSQAKVLSDYNMLIRSELLKNDFIKEVFSNQWYSILHNEKTGEACVENEE